MDIFEVYDFTEEIQNVVSKISVGEDNLGNISPLLHWERNAFNIIPKDWDVLLSHIYEADDSEWKRQKAVGTVYHFEHKVDGDFIIKTHRDSGQEAVYNTLTGEISIGNSTFNYAPQSSLTSAAKSSKHGQYDMVTHEKLYVSEEVYVDINYNGVAPPKEMDSAVSIYNEKSSIPEVKEAYDKRKDEIALARAGKAVTSDGKKERYVSRDERDYDYTWEGEEEGASQEPQFKGVNVLFVMPIPDYIESIYERC